MNTTSQREQTELNVDEQDLGCTRSDGRRYVGNQDLPVPPKMIRVPLFMDGKRVAKMAYHTFKGTKMASWSYRWNSYEKLGWFHTGIPCFIDRYHEINGIQDPLFRQRVDAALDLGRTYEARMVARFPDPSKKARRKVAPRHDPLTPPSYGLLESKFQLIISTIEEGTPSKVPSMAVEAKKAMEVCEYKNVKTTSIARQRAFDYFAKFLGKKWYGPLNLITADEARSWISHLAAKRKLSKDTLIQLAGFISPIFKDLQAGGLIRFNPFHQIAKWINRCARTKTFKVPAFEHAEVFVMIAYCGEEIRRIASREGRTSNSWNTRKKQIELLWETKLLIMLGYFSGANILDIARLERKAVDHEERMLSFRRMKTGEDVKVFLPKACCDLIKKVQYQGGHSGTRIFSHLGSPKHHMVPHYQFKKVMEATGVRGEKISEKRYSRSFRSFRVLMRTELRQAKVDRTVSCAIMGHLGGKGSYDTEIHDGYNRVSVEDIQNACLDLQRLRMDKGYCMTGLTAINRQLRKQVYAAREQARELIKGHQDKLAAAGTKRIFKKPRPVSSTGTVSPRGTIRQRRKSA